ncbi:hypothetical protein [Alkaliphilus peptidifermentans]|uniref:Phage tail assembly chaperone protein, TAC n=1 Tax=Alkaliphilus peptidifermentans DSM 18978 TaxID=1120976 RepID=A0A1G5EDU7_9FIRM|nr:hypothetical protein [Alkaliphilus peptidifermentans]SCY25107.1 hypothetical protein SAMN03080606_01128 [Alkaliphilus peptidifermentans DSM 18978]
MGKMGVTLELDRPRTLRYGMNALVKIEELTGKPISKLDLENISMKDLRTIVYGGLFHEDKSLTPEVVGNLIDEYSSMETVAEKLGKAMELAFGGGKSKRPAVKKNKEENGALTDS